MLDSALQVDGAFDLFKVELEVNLPFYEEQFNVCTISYGIRNVEVPKMVIKEIYRVTKAQGRLIVVESSIPRNKILRSFLTIHFKYFVPRLACFISSYAPAYSYYFNSVEQFQSGINLLKILKKTGWKNIRLYQKLFGAVTILIGFKL